MADLKESQQLAWIYQADTPHTIREALGRLQETVEEGVALFDADRLVPAQTTLEDALLQLLVAMKSLNIEPDEAINRALKRLKNNRHNNVFYMFSDRVEVRVNGDLRGEWPLYSQDDYTAFIRLARELSCSVVHHDTRQLELFS